MKSGLSLGLSVALGMLWLPYATAFAPGVPGNPNKDGYAGGSDGTYDIAANPPKTNGMVTYNPYAPLPAGTNKVLGMNGSGTLPPAANTPAR